MPRAANDGAVMLRFPAALTAWCRRAVVRRTVAAVLTGLVLFGGAVYVAARSLWPYPVARLAPENTVSRRFLDRHGRDLRVLALPDGTKGDWVALAEMGPWLPLATLAIEDHRFFWHPGIDPLATVRAALGNIVSGRVVAGGSTISQQLARLLRGDTTRGSWRLKLSEAWDALRLERAVDKRTILEQYLNRAPYGSQCRGVRPAAALYFGKSPDKLSPGEAAMLAGLTRAPDAYSPYAHPDRARARRDTVLARMRDLAYLNGEEYARAAGESLAVQPARSVWRAPHFLAALANGRLDTLPVGSAPVRTTLDLDVQTAAEGLLRSHLRSLERHNAHQAALVVLDAQSGDILAWVGSPDFFAGSQVDGVLARRQPGSALKPFTYALAFAAGRTPADLVADVPITGLADGFSPENYDREYHGPVRMREALACSYNIPAVRTLKDYVTTGRLLEFLRGAGCASLDRPAGHYGLALTLGAGEVTLLELARAYALLARGGRILSARALTATPVAAGATLLPVEAAALVTSILSDENARVREFGHSSALRLAFPAAVKTGTSKDYRDN